VTPEIVERVTKLAKKGTDMDSCGCALERVAHGMGGPYGRLTAVAKKQGLTENEAWGVMAGWDSMANGYPYDYGYKNSAGFDEGYELGRALYECLVMAKP
jgi:hypothetical protein